MGVGSIDLSSLNLDTRSIYLKEKRARILVIKPVNAKLVLSYALGNNQPTYLSA